VFRIAHLAFQNQGKSAEMAARIDSMVTGEKGVIEAVGLSKVFSDSEGECLEALNGFNLRVRSGEFVSLLGPSGCGKSTFLRIVAGLETATEGSVSLDGEVITGTNYKRGLVFQSPKLFPWMSVYENVAFGPRSLGIYRENKSKVMEYINMVGLGEFSRAFPHQLSGGMAQRAALARALINAPEVLCLDEPLGALDAFTRMNMQDELLRVWNTHRVTMIMVTHDVDEAIYLSDRIVIMRPRPGKIDSIVAVDFPRPRDRNSEAFTKMRHELLQIFHFQRETVQAGGRPANERLL
jgi:ABC-type nitrate/sulfonate/bicarbonate transport system ATPase subunit